MDFTDGLSKDTAGVDYIATKKIDGIISTRINIIKAAKDNGIFCIQRFFMIDSRSMETTIESMRQIKPDMIEIMPGIAYKAIEKIGSVFEIPIIAGGLVEYKDEVYKALAAGAAMVSTGKKEIGYVAIPRRGRQFCPRKFALREKLKIALDSYSKL